MKLNNLKSKIMFKRVTHKERSPLTLAKLESLSEIGLENFVEMSEINTLYRIIHTFDFLTDLMNEPLANKVVHRKAATRKEGKVYYTMDDVRY